MKDQDSSGKFSEEIEIPKQVIRGRRMEDELRLRELELQTNFQINTLSQSLEVLKTEFHAWRDSLNEKLTKVESEVTGLKTRLTAIIVLILAQAGIASGLLSRLVV